MDAYVTTLGQIEKQQEVIVIIKQTSDISKLMFQSVKVIFLGASDKLIPFNNLNVILDYGCEGYFSLSIHLVKS